MLKQLDSFGTSVGGSGWRVRARTKTGGPTRGDLGLPGPLPRVLTSLTKARSLTRSWIALRGLHCNVRPDRQVTG